MNILVIAEHDNNNLKPATLNTVAAANAIGGAVHILVAGNSCQSVADEAAAVDGVEEEKAQVKVGAVLDGRAA